MDFYGIRIPEECNLFTIKRLQKQKMQVLFFTSLVERGGLHASTR